MTAQNLKLELRRLGIQYGKSNALDLDQSHTSAILFRKAADNFHPLSYSQILGSPALEKRSQKEHQTVSGCLEMQSSNSSDALLMNIFCHPKAHTWKSLRVLLGLGANGFNPVFGFAADVRLKNGKTDATEIDMVIGDIFFEAKLTEGTFTKKHSSVVDSYADLEKRFHVDRLRRVNGDYDNYQVIRNLLAAIQHNKKHVLFCDERRPDLVRRYFESVSCLKDVRSRSNCKVIFWQEIAAACGRDLGHFLKLKYGI